MIKILGAIAVVAASVTAGFVMARELGERVRLLKEILCAAVYIKSEMEYRMPVLEECFRARGEFFENVSNLIKKGSAPGEAVVKAADEEPRLQKGDRELLYSYAKGLEAEEIGGQTANVSLLITSLEQKIREAEEENSVKCRLYRSGGVLAGIAFVIIMI